MNAIYQDVLYAMRQFRKEGRFTFLAVLTLAIGIGANTAMFSTMDALVLRPLALPEVSRVVAIMERRPGSNANQVTFGNYADWKKRSHSFIDMAARSVQAMNLTSSGDPERIEASSITANLFDVLKVQPWIGRSFRPEENQPGHEQVALLSYSFWQKHFAGDRNVIGKSILLSERSYTIIGIMPQGFRYGSSSDLWLPLAITPQREVDRTFHDFQVVARLQKGVSSRQAEAELVSIAAQLATTYPKTNEGWSVRLQSLADFVTGDVTASYLKLMMGVVLFVQLIICANVSNLQFSRSLQRQQELAIRSALGAGKKRILRQLLTESILLGLLGALGGLVVAKINLHLTLLSMPQRIARFLPGWNQIGLNGRVLAYSLGMAITAGVIAGLAPAFLSMRISVVEQLKAGSRTLSEASKTHRLRNAFAITQITLSVALVTGALLMNIGMFSMLHRTDRFEPSKVLTFQLNLPGKRYITAAQQSEFYRRTLERISTLPGVKSAELSSDLPYNNWGGWSQEVNIENRPPQPGDFRGTQRITISSGHTAAMHISLLQGRYLSSSDTAETLPVAVISRRFAERYFPNQDPIGQKIRLGKGGDTPWLTIVGVVEDVVMLWIEQPAQPAVYLSYNQFPLSNTTYAIHTTGNPLDIAPAVRRVIASQDAALPLDAVQTYAGFLHESLIGLWYVVVMFAVDAGIALFLAALGIFGVMSNTVTERTQEIGIRMALGADQSKILAMVMRHCLQITMIGLSIGLIIAAGLARLLAGLVYGTSIGSYGIYAGTAAIVLLVTLAAGYLPARRAVAIEPMQALHSE